MIAPYTRYLAAKKSVDDRALNNHVIDVLRTQLGPSQDPLSVLEVGAGLGTMIARAVDLGLLTNAQYTLLDVDAQSLTDSREWLSKWAARTGRAVDSEPAGLRIMGGEPCIDVIVRMVCSEADTYMRGAQNPPVDLLIANAVLDVLDVPSTLPGLFELLKPGGHYWFSINFDGETIFEPGHASDGLLMAAYHRTMDERVRFGRPAGESCCGRHLFAQLRAAQAQVLASGSSDWVVHAACDGRYQDDEAYFVEFILLTIEEALTGQPDVDSEVLASWLKARRAQLASGELLYIAHQIDYCGRVP